MFNFLLLPQTKKADRGGNRELGGGNMFAQISTFGEVSSFVEGFTRILLLQNSSAPAIVGAFSVLTIRTNKEHPLQKAGPHCA